MDTEQRATEAQICATLMNQHLRKKGKPTIDAQAVYDRIMAGKPRICYMILESVTTRDGEYIPCIAQEGTPGYYHTDWHWGKDLAMAEALVKEKNEDIGVSEDEAVFIQSQSMRLQNVARKEGR